MLGAILALASAGFFGLNNATVRRGVLKTTVLQGMAITVPLGVPLFVAFSLAMGGFEALLAWRAPAWFWMSLAGVVHFVIGRYGNYRATQTLGATLSTPIQQLSILVALTLAFIFLGESINLLNLFGIVLIMLGPMVLVGSRKKTAAAGRAKGFEPQFGPGIFWGAVCAFGYGVSPLLIVIGLGAAPTLADAVAGVFVSYVAASIVVIVLVVRAGGKSYLAQVDGTSAKWFLASTLFVALSQMFRYLALAVAPVSVVVPIQRLSVVFRILFNAVINRDHEVLDRNVIFTIFLAVIGSVLLTANSEFLFAAVGMNPQSMRFLIAPLF